MPTKKPSRSSQKRRLTPATTPTPGATSLPASYAELLDDLKRRIQAAQIRAALAVNRELLRLYWQIGRNIVARQETERWGSAVIERLGRDLQSAFPGVQGFSTSNIWRMRAFYLTYRDASILARPVRETDADLPASVIDLPWGHHVVLIEKVKDETERTWYAAAALHHGWSRNILLIQIETKLFRRQRRAPTNFAKTLPPPQSDLAQHVLKDPYNFDFLTLGKDAHERDIERGLVGHVKDFLLELGVGFAFVGRQVKLEVEGDEFYLDLLFYHLKLRAYVVIELKGGAFKPEHAGKMNFYLSAVDDLLRHPSDQPSIGIILCRKKKRLVIEYALRDTNKPIGVSAFELTEKLPETLKGSLPTVEELEDELGAEVEEEGKK